MKFGMKKKGVLLGLASTVLVVSGCSFDDIKNYGEKGAETIEEVTEAVDTVVETTAVVAETVVAANDTVSVGEISDEAFEKAFAKYLKENPIQFGEQLDEAYGIYQKDLQSQRDEQQKKNEEERAELIKNVRDITEADHVEGKRDAQFVLFEYSDYHCPFCRQFNTTTKEFLKNNDDVAVVFRPYPAVHKTTAQPLHEVAECIAKESGNDAFWKFTDNLFETQFKAKDISAKLSELKIDNSEKIMKCYNDKEFTATVDKSAQEAVSLGIQGTPGSILKNMKTGEVLFINGAQPLEALEAAREQLLKNK